MSEPAFPTYLSVQMAAVTQVDVGIYQPRVPVQETDPLPHDLVLSEELRTLYILAVLAKRNMHRCANAYNFTSTASEKKTRAKADSEIAEQWHSLVQNIFNTTVRHTYSELLAFPNFKVGKDWIVVGVEVEEKVPARAIA